MLPESSFNHGRYPSHGRRVRVSAISRTEQCRRSRCSDNHLERAIAWIGRNRRMSKGSEYLNPTSEAMVHLAMSRLMLRHVAKMGAT